MEFAGGCFPGRSGVLDPDALCSACGREGRYQPSVLVVAGRGRGGVGGRGAVLGCLVGGASETGRVYLDHAGISVGG